MSFGQEKFNQMSQSYTSVSCRSSSVSLVPWSTKCHNFSPSTYWPPFESVLHQYFKSFCIVSHHEKGFIIAFPWQIYSHRLQHIIWELDWETPNNTLDLHASMEGILFINGRFTSLTSHRWISFNVRLQKNLFTFDEMCWDILEIIVINGDSPRIC